MGTRSLTHIYSKPSDSTPLVTIYRQYDGYPEAMGKDIKAAIGAKQLTNGCTDKSRQCNGMGCAAAMLIGALKNGECGNVYIYPTGSTDCGEEYTYRIYPAGETFRLVIDGIYDGEIGEFDPASLVEA